MVKTMIQILMVLLLVAGFSLLRLGADKVSLCQLLGFFALIAVFFVVCLIHDLQIPEVRSKYKKIFSMVCNKCFKRLKSG